MAGDIFISSNNKFQILKYCLVIIHFSLSIGFGVNKYPLHFIKYIINFDLSMLRWLVIHHEASSLLIFR